ncbi:MAG: hypothetical protein H6712_10045 [Myxococcales bacterium]|nr:hypothetical protein [Myxococcales bacterium]MCB9714187.1 hypothetical protein [Myxococcales bacterium]
MSDRCREVAGILFKRKCQLVATQTCSQCNKPTCHLHIRVLGGKPLCIACAREKTHELAGSKDSRGSLGHLRDDPYFYWYYESGRWFDDGYETADFDVFSEDDGSDLGADVDDHWEGT